MAPDPRSPTVPDVAGTAPLFTFERVSVAFEDSLALDGVSAQVPGDGITVLVGPSGAGKSTLLRLCNRLEIPTSGHVRLRGGSIDDLDPLELRRQVAMVFQQPTLFGGTVRDNLLVAAAGSTDDEHVAMLEQVGLDVELLDREADTLSGGEAQRACLARSLLTAPHALLLDEPTSALDAAPTRVFERTATRLAQRAIPMVWVTHDLDQARRVGDRAIVLDRGRLVAQVDDIGSLADDEHVARLFAGEPHDA